MGDPELSSCKLFFIMSHVALCSIYSLIPILIKNFQKRLSVNYSKELQERKAFMYLNFKLIWKKLD